jgi:hypothetical protein
MSDKRKRQTSVLCTDQVWSDFQGLATERGTTLPQLLGEVVESQVALRSSDQQGTLTEVVEETAERVEETAERVPRALPPRTLIGFGHPVVRIR